MVYTDIGFLTAYIIWLASTRYSADGIYIVGFSRGAKRDAFSTLNDNVMSFTVNGSTREDVAAE
jgi:hypothetical protein